MFRFSGFNNFCSMMLTSMTSIFVRLLFLWFLSALYTVFRWLIHQTHAYWRHPRNFKIRAKISNPNSQEIRSNISKASFQHDFYRWISIVIILITNKSSVLYPCSTSVKNVCPMKTDLGLATTFCHLFVNITLILFCSDSNIKWFLFSYCKGVAYFSDVFTTQFLRISHSNV